MKASLTVHQCDAELEISDDHGDNHATMHCQLPSGHSDRHQEKYDRVTIQWEEE